MEKSINIGGFDVEAFLDNYPDPAKQSMDRLKRSSLYSEYSLPWNCEKVSPFPEMELNSSNVRWEPIDIDYFISKYGEEFKDFKVAYMADLFKDKSPSSCKRQNKKVPTKKMQPKAPESTTQSEEKIIEMSEKDKAPESSTDPVAESVIPDIVFNNPPDSPLKEVIKEADTIEATASNENNSVPNNVTKLTINDDVVIPDIVEDANFEADMKRPTCKVPRISAKMRRASRAEFHDTYLIKTDTKGGKPITIAPDLIERAYRICIRSGDYKACPTYLFNNLLRKALDLIEPDTESWAALD